MTNEDMLQIAMEQSAEDIGCRAEDFLATENKVVPFQLSANAKKYNALPIGANFISYGNNIVAGASEELLPVVSEYIKKFEFYHCFETPHMHWLNKRLEPFGQTACFMAEYYLPDLANLQELAKQLNLAKHNDISCKYELRILEQDDFRELYLPEWSNALCKDRKQLDVLGVGAYDNGKLIGLAGCSADAEKMWQIGVDVLPKYRRQKIGSAITTRLALEILERGKVPFYCSAWSNIRSVGNAIRSGFLPAWVEMTIKPISKVEELNA